jgi:anti-sigma regulatory factor (Ser/Thr protein kinase)
MATPAAWLVLELGSDTAWLAMLRELGFEFARLGGFEAAEAEQLALALVEAATNVIEHAYAGTPQGRLELRFELGPELRIELLDQGLPVEPGSVPHVDLERYKRERRNGGLGLHLMARIMDSVSFERREGCNVCCLSKRTPGAGRP